MPTLATGSIDSLQSLRVRPESGVNFMENLRVTKNQTLTTSWPSYLVSGSANGESSGHRVDDYLDAGVAEEAVLLSAHGACSSRVVS